MKCLKCNEEMPRVLNTYGLDIYDLEDENGVLDSAKLFVCTSRDCVNCGVVMCIPLESKEDI